MSSDTPITTGEKYLIWLGRFISGLMTAAMLMSAGMKLTQSKELVEGFAKFGYDQKLAVPIGIVEVVCAVVYAIPQTSVLGAILLTGYLGGAIATHVRINDEFVPPIVIGVLLWLGLVFRDRKLRALLPFRRG